MEIYQLSNYENIGDRLKRLANNASIATANPVDTYQVQGQKATQYGNTTKIGNMSTEMQSRVKTLQSLRYGKFSTLETQYRPQEQKEYRGKQLTSPRENRLNITQERLRKPTNNRNIESNTTLNSESEKTEDRSFPWKNTQPAQTNEGNDRKKALSKVKSDSNIKIEDILESFNSYKQNKEKFMSTINKTFAKEQPSTKEGEKVEKIDEKKQAFRPIDNIRNERSQEGPKFQRSLKSYRQSYEEGYDMANPVDQTTYDKRAFTKPRPLSKNTIKYENLQNTQKPQMKSLLSPRGTRIPGKICRNV